MSPPFMFCMCVLIDYNIITERYFGVTANQAIHVCTLKLMWHFVLQHIIIVPGFRSCLQALISDKSPKNVSVEIVYLKKMWRFH